MIKHKQNNIKTVLNECGFFYTRKEKKMKILIACEENQRVCTAFRNKGHEAYSADIQECSGGHPEWHIQGDVLPIINGN